MDWHKRRKEHTHYPVPGNFTVGRTSGVDKVLYFNCPHHCGINAVDTGHHVAVDGKISDDLRIKLPASARLYIPSIRACALKLPVYYRKSDGSKIRDSRGKN